ncbi:MAG: hydrolase TatD [Candidatus Kerfeldbacteria bacterium CG08_land_8_20_14_0_20_40_16]|uniref:Hydrolase TatD n=1 Tax=Candidatus Kerfeldbacteria bacterium CG08_land_8_20_14_0_20_40_16 TaxID=2014244 RepID=A0A2H0YWI4_9BACT|nr:MAG: hydrolase TatD [Candidatus Kerfeldbacteria bacterium CG08_land_8_20_14_0_20_40_16]
MLIDTHTHVNFNAFKEDGPDVIDRSLREKIWLINVGSQTTTSKRAVNIAVDFKEGIYAAVGLHPIHLHEIKVDESEVAFQSRKEEFNPQEYRELALNSKTVAIGETGLDYFHIPKDEDFDLVKKKQEDIFKQQIALAVELGKPLTIHSRGTEADPNEVYQDIMAILKQFPEAKGVIHCYSGNLETAKQFIEIGFLISFTGIVTFKNAKETQLVAKELPLDKILVETDAPYLAPEPYRGKRNEPAYVKYIALKIAELKGISFKEVAKVTTENARKLFNI